MTDSVRVDKWLQVARAFKTRSQATKACTLSRVRVNGNVAKAHRNLQLEDRVEVDYRDWTRIFVVKELRDKTLPKAEVPRIFEDLSPPKPKLDEMQKLMLRAPVIRERGLGRPSKRDRRRMDKFRDEDIANADSDVGGGVSGVRGEDYVSGEDNVSDEEGS